MNKRGVVMKLTKKEQIIDNYAKDIKDYLHIGLCEGQANGSFGEDLIEHFDIMVNSFKEITRIEDELGIDLITLFKAMKNGCYAKDKNNNLLSLLEYDKPILYFEENEQEWCFVLDVDLCHLLPHDYLYLKDYGKTWALTREELE